MKVRKAVIAAAGFGTRFLPQTKAMPKEMLPIVDKPIIQYVVEELVEAGIEDIIIVTGYSKRSIEDHFDAPSQDLINNLKAGGPSKEHLLEEIEAISDLANFVYVRQKGPQGNAAPLMSVEHLLGDEPFIYTWADDFVLASPSRFKQMISVHEEFGGSVLTCVRASSEADYGRYGFAGGEQVRDGLLKANIIVEKPGTREAAPSDLASVSGYIFEPKLFDYLHVQLDNVQLGREFTMQESMQKMMHDGHNYYALEIQNGKYYDAGNKLEYLKTVVDFGLMHEDIREDFMTYLRSLNI